MSWQESMNDLFRAQAKSDGRGFNSMTELNWSSQQLYQGCVFLIESLPDKGFRIFSNPFARVQIQKRDARRHPTTNNRRSTVPGWPFFLRVAAYSWGSVRKDADFHSAHAAAIWSHFSLSPLLFSPPLPDHQEAKSASSIFLLSFFQ